MAGFFNDFVMPAAWASTMDIGGRYSALTAFGLVPSGLAGVDINALLDEAEVQELELAQDGKTNPGLILAAAIAGTSPLKDKLGIVADGTHIVGFADWAEQLIAESTGKLGKGILPVVLGLSAPELTEDPRRQRQRSQHGRPGAAGLALLHIPGERA